MFVDISASVPTPGMQSHPFLLGEWMCVVCRASRLQRNTEVFICDIFLNLLFRLCDTGELRMCGLALERDIDCGVHCVADAGAGAGACTLD